MLLSLKFIKRNGKEQSIDFTAHNANEEITTPTNVVCLFSMFNEETIYILDELFRTNWKRFTSHFLSDFYKFIQLRFIHKEITYCLTLNKDDEKSYTYLAIDSEDVECNLSHENAQEQRNLLQEFFNTTEYLNRFISQPTDIEFGWWLKHNRDELKELTNCLNLEYEEALYNTTVKELFRIIHSIIENKNKKIFVSEVSLAKYNETVLNYFIDKYFNKDSKRQLIFKTTNIMHLSNVHPNAINIRNMLTHELQPLTDYIGIGDTDEYVKEYELLEGNDRRNESLIKKFIEGRFHV